MSITDKNWLEKLFIKEAKAAKNYHNRGGSGGSGEGSGVIDVDELPTEGIEQDKIYRVTKTTASSATIYVFDGSTAATLESICDSKYGQGNYARGAYEVVDSLPENGTDGEGYTYPVYVVRDTGEAFMWTSADGFVPVFMVATMMGLAPESYTFKGLAQDNNFNQGEGFYTVISGGESSTTYGIPDISAVKVYKNGAWVNVVEETTQA